MTDALDPARTAVRVTAIAEYLEATVAGTDKLRCAKVETVTA